MLGYVIIGGILVVMVVPAAVQVLVPAAIGAVWRLVRPKLRGATGESKVNRCLRKFKGKDFARVKNAMLATQEKTSQIDNLLVSPYGIFVIETKNYAGIVLGDERTAKWEQIVPGSKQKPRGFLNPIWQNRGHIKALKQLLNPSFPNLKFYNVVVFSDGCETPNVPGVVKMRDLHDFLSDNMNGRPILTSKDVSAIKKIIKKNNIKDRSKRTEHVAYAKDTAFQAKERERKEDVRKRAEGNKDMALRVQMAYSQGRSLALGNSDASALRTAERKPALSEQIQAASKFAGQGRSDNKASVKEAGRER